MKRNSQAVELSGVTGEPLIWLRLEGVVVLILSILLYAQAGASWWRFGALLLAPDLVMAGYWLGARWGARIYNLGHTYAGPLTLAVVGLIGGYHWLVPYQLIWTAHIGMDRALGYGLKYASGFKNTHLGTFGKRAAMAYERTS